MKKLFALFVVAIVAAAQLITIRPTHSDSYMRDVINNNFTYLDDRITAGGGGGTWGSITGTLGDQTDLQSALDAKAASDHTQALNKGGTAQTSWTAGRCVQVSADGKVLESASEACGGSQVEYIRFRTVSQNTVAGPNFSLPASNAPTLTTVEGANSGDPSAAASAWNYGVLAFADNASAATAQSVQGFIDLPSTWSSSAGIVVALKWRTAATEGDVVWQIQGQCVADGEVPGDFGSASAFTTDTAKGTTLQWNDVAAKTLTTSDVLSGCAAGETFLFRLFRDATHESDTVVGAQLISATFKLTR